MTSTGFWSPLTCSLVEYSLEILQSSALGQVSQARVLQGSGLGGFSNDRSVECIHVPVAKLLPLQRRERLGEILLVRTRRVAPIRASVSAGETGRTVWPIDHQNLCSWVTTVAFGCGLCGASRTGRRGIRRAQLPRLVGWPTGGPPHASPTSEASTDWSACAGEKQGREMPREPTDTGSTAATGGHHERMRESASPRGRGAR